VFSKKPIGQQASRPLAAPTAYRQTATAGQWLLGHVTTWSALTEINDLSVGSDECRPTPSGANRLKAGRTGRAGRRTARRSIRGRVVGRRRLNWLSEEDYASHAPTFRGNFIPAAVAATSITRRTSLLLTLPFHWPG